MFTNQASVRFRGRTIQSNVVQSEYANVLNMWKDATTDFYRADEILTYVISIQNAGAV